MVEQISSSTNLAKLASLAKRAGMSEKQKIAKWVEELKAMPEIRDEKLSNLKERSTLTSQELHLLSKKILHIE